MRQIRTTSILLSMLMLFFVSCGSKNKFDKESVNYYVEKINKGETLSQDDYAAMTDIMTDAYEQIFPDTKKILELSAKAAANDNDASKELEKLTTELDKKYADLNPIMQSLMTGTPEQMGENTYKRFHKLVEDGQKTIEDYTREVLGKTMSLIPSAS